MARTKNPHQAALKSWETRRAGPLASKGDWRRGGTSGSKEAMAIEAKRVSEWFRSGDNSDPMDEEGAREWARDNPELYGALIEQWARSTRINFADWTEWGSGPMNRIANEMDAGRMPVGGTGEQWVAGFHHTASRMEAVWSVLNDLSGHGEVSSETTETLYRGMTLRRGTELAEVGGTFYDPIMSFSDTEWSAKNFSRSYGPSDQSVSKVILRTEGPVRQINLSGHGEGERVTGGTFKVTSIERLSDGTKVYTVRQVGLTKKPKPPWLLKGKPPKVLRSQWQRENARRKKAEYERKLGEIVDIEIRGGALTASQQAFMDEYRKGLGLK
jgi:hypothetical protein